MYDFTTLGALIGLAIAIVLIIRKVHPAYSLILGALAGGIIGGVNLSFGDRMKLIPFEACVGLTATAFPAKCILTNLKTHSSIRKQPGGDPGLDHRPAALPMLCPRVILPCGGPP